MLGGGEMRPSGPRPSGRCSVEEMTGSVVQALGGRAGLGRGQMEKGKLKSQGKTTF